MLLFTAQPGTPQQLGWGLGSRMTVALLLFCLSTLLFAQKRQLLTGTEASESVSGAQRVVLDEHADPAVVQFKPGTPALLGLKQALKLPQESQLQLVRTEKDQLGMVHQRFQQTINGVPVVGGVYLLHSQNGSAISANGRTYRQPMTMLSPSVGEEQARVIAVKHTGSKSFMWERPGAEALLKKEQSDAAATFFPNGKLVYTSKAYDKKAPLVLAYQFDIYSADPIARYNVEVSATDGSVINFYNKLHGVAPAEGTGETLYNGTVALQVEENSGTYTLEEYTRGDGILTYDVNNNWDYSNITQFTSATGHFEGDRAKAGVSAHFGSAATYDYFLRNFDRNSFDANGGAIRSYVHFGQDYVNAFWDGERMTYGDGDGSSILPLVSLDIVGHEIVHGVTQYAANLVYAYEPGALNESFSDIFGQAIEMETFPETASWNLADEIFTDGVSMIRSMSNPNSQDQPDTYFGDYWFTEDWDNGGVHFNSGVQNFWFYLLVEGGTGTNDHGYEYNVPSIGLDKAQQVAYRNLTVYLTETSGYQEARWGAEQSAIDLYGEGSPEHEAVIAAWNAVGVPSANPTIVVAEALDFGQKIVDTEVMAVLNVTNSGAESLEISAIQIDNPVFYVMDSAFLVNGLATYQLVVYALPGLGQSEGLMTLFTNDRNVEVALRVEGVAEPEFSATPDKIELEMYAGDIVSQSVSITNENDYDVWVQLNGQERALRSAMQYAPTGEKVKVGKSTFDAYAPVNTQPILVEDEWSGYYWKDSQEGVEFEWIEIADIGTQVTLYDDSNTDFIDMGMEFPFFGNLFSSVAISSNGWVSFSDNSWGAWSIGLPSYSAPANVIALMSSDLYPGDYGTCHYYFDPVEEVFVVQYTNWTYCCTSEPYFTMQLQLQEGGKMLLLYKDVNAQIWSTVGMQNDDYTKALTVAVSTSFLKSGYAIEIGPHQNWLKTSQEGLWLPAGATESIDLTVDTKGLLSGDYRGELTLRIPVLGYSDDVVDVRLDVTGAAAIDVVSELTFGDLFVGDSTLRRVLVGNRGVEVLSISDVSIASGSSFEVNGYTAEVAPEGIIEYDVWFKPEQAGAFEATLEIASNDPTDPSVMVHLSGVGLNPPVISVTPEAIEAALLAGESTSTEITISNTGESDLVVRVSFTDKRNSSGSSVLPKLQMEPTTSLVSSKSIVLESSVTGKSSLHEFDSLVTLPNFPSGTSGMVYVDGMIYCLQYYNGTMLKYDLSLGEVTESFLIHTGAFGITFDGDNFWIGGDDGTIRLYTLEGEYLGGFTSPVSYAHSIAFDGEHIFITGADYFNVIFIYNKMAEEEGIIYREDYDELVNLTYEAGYFWGLDWSYDAPLISQLKLENNVFEKVGEFRLPFTSSSYYSLAHDGENLMVANWYGQAFVLDDGVASWLKVSASNATVLPGESFVLDVTLDASVLNGGSYEKVVRISSNDPANRRVEIPVSLQVTGIPDIQVAESVELAPVFYGDSSYATFTIQNIGSDLLQLSQVALANGTHFRLEGQFEDILPGGMLTFGVWFLPESAQLYEDAVHILSNDPDQPETAVVLTGEGLEPPVLVYDPQEINATVYAGNVETVPVTFFNEGGSDLMLTFSRKELPGAEGGSSLAPKRGFYSKRANEPFVSKLKQPETSKQPVAQLDVEPGNVLEYLTNFPTSIHGMVHVDGVIYGAQTWNARIVKYNIGTKSVEGYFNTETYPFDITYDGEVLWVADEYGVFRAYTLDGELVGSFDAPYEGTFNITFDGQYLVLVDVWNGNFYQVQVDGIVVGTKEMSETVDCYDLAFGNNRLWWLDGTSWNPKVFEIDYHLQGSVHFDQPISFWLDRPWNEYYYALAHTGEDLIVADWSGNAAILDDGIMSWIALSDSVAVVPAGQSFVLNVELDTRNQDAGVHEQMFYIYTNDPQNRRLEIPVTLEVVGAPNLSLSDSAVVFENIFVGDSSYFELVLQNFGTDALLIDTLYWEDGQQPFTFVSGTQEVAPKSTTAIYIGFEPEASGEYTDTLVIESNDPTNPVIRVTVAATAFPPPVLQITPGSFEFAVTSGELISDAIVLANLGLSDLEWGVAASGGMMQSVPEGFKKKAEGLVPVNNDNVAQTAQVGHIEPVTDFDVLANSYEAITSLVADPRTGLLYGFAQWGNSLYRYNPDENYWEYMSASDYSTSSNHAGVYLDGKIYYFLNYSSVVCIYDIDSNSWTYEWGGYSVSANATTDGTYLYISNGYTLLRYYPANSEWTVLNESGFGDARWGGMAYHEGYLYQHFGNGSSSFARYHIATNAWESLEYVPGSTVLGAALVGDTYYCVGGYWEDRLYAFDILTLQWKETQSLPFYVGDTDLEYFGGNLYIVQGEIGNGFISIPVATGAQPQIAFSAESGIIPPEGEEEVGFGISTDGVYTGAYAVDFTVYSNDPHQRQLLVPVSLTVTGFPQLETVSDIDFSQIYTGQETYEQFTIQNTGTDTLWISQLAVESPFYVIDSAFYIRPNGRKIVGVVFAPQEAGDIERSLLIVSNDPDSPEYSVQLIGKAIDPPVIVVEPGSISEHLISGGSVSQMLEIRNDGLSDLYFWIYKMPSTEPDTLSIKISDEVNSTLILMNGERYAKTEALDPARVLPQNVNLDSSVVHHFQGRLFVTNEYSGKIEEVDISTGAVLNAFSAPTNVTSQDGLAFDGEYLYYKGGYDYTTEIFRIDASSGVVVGSIILEDIYNVDALAHSGQKLYVQDHSQGLIYEIDFDNAVVDRVISLGLGQWGGMSYGGSRSTLFVSRDQMIYEVDLQSGWVHNHYWTGGGIAYGIGYSEQSQVLFFADGYSIKGLDVTTGQEVWSYPWYSSRAMASDEMGYNWLELSKTSGFLPGGESMEVEITLKSEELLDGSYFHNINIYSNDPVNGMLSLPVQLDITGVPTISAKDTVHFEWIYAGQEALRTVRIQNDGTGDLTISGMFTNSNHFSVSDSSLVVLSPRSWMEVPVRFHSVGAGLFTGQLHINSDDPADPEVLVVLVGEAIEPPSIAIAPDKLDVRVILGTQTTYPLEISNDGGSDLYWSAAVRSSGFSFVQSTPNLRYQADSIQGTTKQETKLSQSIPTPVGVVASEPNKTLEEVLHALNEKYEQINSLIPNRLDFSGGEAGSSAMINEFFNLGGFIGANWNQYAYTGSTIVDNEWLEGQYFTAKYPGLFVYAADFGSDVESVQTYGEVYTNWNGQVEATIVQVELNGKFFNGYLRQYYEDTEWPSHSHLIITEARENLSHYYDTQPYRSYHAVNGDAPGTIPGRVYTLLFSTADGSYISNDQITSIMGAFLEVVEGKPVFVVTETSGIVPAGESQTIEVTVDAVDVELGICESNLIVNTNQPGKEQVAVPLRANITLAPNVPPVFDSTWVTEELYHNQLVQMDLKSRVTDTDGAIMKYMMQYDASKLQAVVSNDGMLTMVGLKVGAADLRISVIDNDLDTSSHHLSVRVLNHLPIAKMLLDTVHITNAALTVALSTYFEDQNNETLSYEVTDMRGGLLTATLSGDQLLLQSHRKGLGSLKIRATDSYGDYAEMMLFVDVQFVSENFPPVWDASWTAVEVLYQEVIKTDLASKVQDTNGTVDVYTLSFDATALEASVSETDTLSIKGLRVGSFELKITAEDNDGDTVSQVIMVRVLNHVPQAKMARDTVSLTNEGLTVGLADYFADANDATLTYEVTNLNSERLTITLSGDQLSLQSHQKGYASLTVRATDSHGGFAEMMLVVDIQHVSENFLPVWDANWVSEELYDKEVSKVSLRTKVQDSNGTVDAYTLSFDATALEASVSDTDTLSIKGLRVGSFELKITAEDNDGDTVSHALMVQVLNHSPQALVESDTFTIELAPVTVALDEYFSDANDATLTYAIVAAQNDLLEPTLTGSSLKVESRAIGMGKVQVSATDAHGASASLDLYFDALQITILGVEPVLNWSVYPNPAKGIFKVTTSGDLSGAELELYDFTGKKASIKVMSGADGLLVHTNGLAAGTYLLHIRDVNGVLEVQKVIIE